MLASAAAFVLATACAGADAPARSAAAASVCPIRAGASVSQIDVFDGEPADQAFLAPDDDGKGQNTYTVKAIYAQGRYVTVRCHYGSTVVEDVKLPNPVTRCLFSGGAAHPALSCK